MAKMLLKNGYELVAGCSVLSGITNNCGMHSITGVNVYCYNQTSTFGIEYLREEELLEVINQHWDWVYTALTADISRGLIVISDRVLYQGKQEDHPSTKWVTRDFIRELINRKLGVVTMSPVVRNRTYDPGCHDIQACLWVPPQMQHEIIADASIHVGECDEPVVEYAEKHRKVYDKWRCGVMPSANREEWEAAPAPPKPKDFFEGGERVDKLRQEYVQNRDNPAPPAPIAPPADDYRQFAQQEYGQADRQSILDMLWQQNARPWYEVYPHPPLGLRAPIPVQPAPEGTAREYNAPTAVSELSVRQAKRKRAKK